MNFSSSPSSILGINLLEIMTQVLGHKASKASKAFLKTQCQLK